MVNLNTKSIPLWTIRVAAALGLIMGVVIWPGNADGLILPHVALGAVLSLALLVLAYQGFRAGVSPGLVLLAVIWAVALPVLGLTQGIFPDTLAFAVQVFHLAVGIAAWALAEVLGRRMAK